MMKFLEDRTRLARILFGLDAAMGVLAIASAALYGAALTSGNRWVAFFGMLLPLSALWMLLCFGAYKGLTRGHALLQILFWVYVVGNFFAFPVGTAISAASIWLWRELGTEARRSAAKPVASA